MRYCWLIKQRQSAKYVTEGGSLVDGPDGAQQFETRDQAFDALMKLSERPGTPALELIDKVFYDPAPDDADKTPVPTRQELIDRAKAFGQPRRDASAKARATRPGGQINHRPAAYHEAFPGERPKETDAEIVARQEATQARPTEPPRGRF